MAGQDWYHSDCSELSLNTVLKNAPINVTQSGHFLLQQSMHIFFFAAAPHQLKSKLLFSLLHRGTAWTAPG
jgi:hypothetical protein